MLFLSTRLCTLDAPWYELFPPAPDWRHTSYASTKCALNSDHDWYASSNTCHLTNTGEYNPVRLILNSAGHFLLVCQYGTSNSQLHHMLLFPKSLLGFGTRAVVAWYPPGAGVAALYTMQSRSRFLSLLFFPLPRLRTPRLNFPHEGRGIVMLYNLRGAYCVAGSAYFIMGSRM